VRVQEDFIVTGNQTLELLDAYIQGCDGVIHLVGDTRRWPGSPGHGWRGAIHRQHTGSPQLLPRPLVGRSPAGGG
jgi:hypothetical protein